MNKKELIRLLSSDKFSLKNALKWAEALEGKYSYNNISVVKVGDVYMHKGLRHPYIILKKVKSGYLCGLITSDKDCSEILFKGESRFNDEIYFTKTLIHQSIHNDPFMFIYENKKDIRRLLKELTNLFLNI